MQGNARGTYESGGKVPGERRGMQGNTGKCQRNVWEWVQSAREMLWNAGECQGNIWEWVRDIPGECMEIGPKCHVNAGE